MRLAALMGLLLAGCAPRVVVSSERPLRDFRGIIHCHSKYSHDSKGTYEEILAAAKAAKVDFIIMTDHPPNDDPGRPLREGWRGLHDGVLFIQGAELAGSNLLALGIREPVHGADVPAKIEAIHRQGGLAFVSHPEEVTDWSAYDAADGMEIYNVHAALKRKRKDPRFLAQVMKAIMEDPESSFGLLHEIDEALLKRWSDLAVRRPFSGIAGNDAHQNVNLLGFQLDPYPRAFKFVATHVMAEELTEEAVLQGLRAARCYVAFYGLPQLPPGAGYLRVAAGGTLRRTEVDFLLPVLRAAGRKYVGDEIPTSLDTHGPGVYWLELHAAEGTEQPLVISNGVRFLQPR